MFGKKRGQITIFIILGIIILVGAIVFFVIRGTVTPGPGEEIPGQVLSAEEASIRDYVEACLRPNLLEGLEIQRLQGGFIDIPADAETLAVKDPENKVVKEVNGKKQVVIDANAAGNTVPYWLIEDTANIPTLEKMENDLGSYVLTNFLDCAGDFKAFEDQGYSLDLGSAFLNITMANAVIADLKYPITLRRGDVEVSMNDFIISIPINMEEVYQTAVELAAFEGIYNYLEEHTVDLLSKYGYSGGAKTSDSLPSIAHYEYGLSGCDYVTWSRPEVENRLKGNMHANIPYIKFENTQFDRIVRTDPIEQGVFDSYIYDFFAEDKTNIKIDLSYETSWPFDFDILPRAGEIIKPDTYTMTGISQLGGFCRMKYYFKYDIKYPVLFKVSELNSAKIDPIGNVYEAGKGYNLQFLVQAFVCGNQRRRCTEAPRFLSNLQALAGLTSDALQYYTPLPPSYFCDDTQKISGDITIRAVNKNTNEPIPDAMVSYFCGSRENDCMIGNTNENGILVSKFPYCVNGEVAVMKDGFDDIRQRITINSPSANTYTFSMNPYKELGLAVKKVYVDYLLRNYYMTDGFTADKCTGAAVAVESQLQPIDVLTSDQIIISSTDGKITAMVPPEDTIKLGNGDFEFSYTASQTITVKPSVVGNQTVSYRGDGQSYTGAIPTVMILQTKIEGVQNKDRVIFYVPIEYLSGSEIEMTDLAESAMQADGSLKKTIEIEDCDGLLKEVEVTIPAEKVKEVFTPKLE